MRRIVFPLIFSGGIGLLSGTLTGKIVFGVCVFLILLIFVLILWAIKQVLRGIFRRNTD